VFVEAESGYTGSLKEIKAMTTDGKIGDEAAAGL